MNSASTASDLIDLETRLARRGEAMGNLQLLTRTLVSLTLNDKCEIGDTLTSMVSTFLGATSGATLLAEADGALRVRGRQGISDEALCTPEARAAWARSMENRLAHAVSGGAVAALSRGYAAAAIDIHDKPKGLLVMAGKANGQEFTAEDLEFLGACAGAAAMAFANAESYAAQQELLRSVEAQAAAARREAAEKEVALKELDQKLALIERQRSAIRELSTPVLQLWKSVVALPIIGVVDSRRSAEIMERLLSEITLQQARYVILDITGVEVVDTRTADHFIKVMKAAELLGARCVLTGIRPAVAQTLVEIGVDLSSIVTLRTLQDGLRECLKQMKHSPKTAVRS